MPIETAFQRGAFQQNAFQIIRVFTRVVATTAAWVGRVPVGSLRVITIKPVKNRRAE